MTMPYSYWFGLALLPLVLLLLWFVTRGKREVGTTTADLAGLATNQIPDDETLIYITDSTDSIYSEIELMIAYQDYEKARNIIEQARHNDEEDLWILMLELKLLAATHEIIEFNDKFHKYEPLLSRVYPSAWVQLEVIEEKLNRGNHRTTM